MKNGWFGFRVQLRQHEDIELGVKYAAFKIVNGVGGVKLLLASLRLERASSCSREHEHLKVTRMHAIGRYLFESGQSLLVFCAVRLEAEQKRVN